MNILGISCFYHDAAACLLQDGRVAAAAQEERFTRKRHDQDFPKNAIAYCLQAGGISVADLDYVGFYDKPLLKFERLLMTYIATFPRSLPSFLKAMPVWLHEKLWVPHIIEKELGYQGKTIFTEHHQAHAASAFLASPFEEAAILTVDGVGEWATVTFGHGKNTEIHLHREIRFPHSLGLLYSAFTYFLGFKVNSAEYKVMGLAPYGEPKYYDLIMDNVISVADDGSFRLNMQYFSFDYGLRMTNARMEQLFGMSVRDPESTLEQDHKDIAASLQKVTEEVVLKMCHNLRQETGSKNLCMAGGVALNCVANGRILRETDFDNIFIQPAAGDAGGAMGAAAFIHHTLLHNPRQPGWNHANYGPEFSNEQIAAELQTQQVPYHRMETPALLEEIARLIDEQNVIGWFQGRMEFGPRALGNRSIIADARNPDNQDVVNMKIKFRESFRPFAPTVLEERASEYFAIDCPSPYMLLVAQVREDHRTIPAVTHVDGSARIQTVNRSQNPIYYDLIKAFEQRTGCPVIINTSFNVRGEPIVCTPNDAYTCFRRTNMDFLVMGNFLVDKKEMPEWKEDGDWRDKFALD